MPSLLLQSSWIQKLISSLLYRLFLSPIGYFIVQRLVQSTHQKNPPLPSATATTESSKQSSGISIDDGNSFETKNLENKKQQQHHGDKDDESIKVRLKNPHSKIPSFKIKCTHSSVSSSLNTPVTLNTLTRKLLAPSINTATYKVVTLSVMTDNFSYIIIDEQAKEAVLIDPVDAQITIYYLKKHKLKLIGILTTHKHWDHAAGNRNILLYYQNKNNGLANASSSFGNNTSSTIPSYMGEKEFSSLWWFQKHFMGINRVIMDGQEIQLGSMVFQGLLSPWHTQGHTMYLFKGNKDPNVQMNSPFHLFTGDAIFVNGVGKFFEGTPSAFYNFVHCHLHPKTGSIPQNTLLWPGHNYADINLRFSLWISPNDPCLLNNTGSIEMERLSCERSVDNSAAIHSTACLTSHPLETSSSSSSLHLSASTTSLSSSTSSHALSKSTTPSTSLVNQAPIPVTLKSQCESNLFLRIVIDSPTPPLPDSQGKNENQGQRKVELSVSSSSKALYDSIVKKYQEIKGNSIELDLEKEYKNIIQLQSKIQNSGNMNQLVSPFSKNSLPSQQEFAFEERKRWGSVDEIKDSQQLKQLSKIESIQYTLFVLWALRQLKDGYSVQK